MAELTTIARPYAQAVFELARNQNAYQRWSEALALATAIVADARVLKWIAHPRVRPAQVAELILDVAGDHLDADARNFVRLLVENRRLTVLPEIAALYADYRAEAERTQQAEVISAQPLSNEQQASIVAALERRLQRAVTLHCQVDEALLGGAIIRAGDLVIDGSVTSQLGRLATAMAR